MEQSQLLWGTCSSVSSPWICSYFLSCTCNRSFLLSSYRLLFLLCFYLHLFFLACLCLNFPPFERSIWYLASKPLRLFLLSWVYAFQYLGTLSLNYPIKFPRTQALLCLTKLCQLFREKDYVLNSSTSCLPR